MAQQGSLQEQPNQERPTQQPPNLEPLSRRPLTREQPHDNSRRGPLHTHPIISWITIVITVLTFLVLAYDRLGPSSEDRAREALAKMGYKFDDEGFSDANSEPNVDAIKLYLKGGKSPNTTYSGTFMLDLPLMKKSEKFPEILEIYQHQKTHLDFTTVVGAPPTSVQVILTQANSKFTMADVLFQELAYQDSDYSKRMAHLLLNAGAHPDTLLAALRTDKSGMDEFLSDPRHRQDDAILQGMGEGTTSSSLRRTNQQLKFMEEVIAKQ